MNRIGRAAVAGLMLGTIAAGKASATDWLGNNGGVPYCGGNTFSTCFSVNMSWTAAAGSTITVTLKLTNTDPAAGLKWFGVGIDNLSNGTQSLSSYTATGPNADWTLPPPNNFSGGPFVDPTASMVNNGGESPGFSQRTWTFNLTMSGALSVAQWDALLQAAGVGVHAGGVTINGQSCSTKVVVRDNLAPGPAYGTNGPDGSNPLCEENPSPPTEVVPEPATMSLMAIGLVGLVGAAAIRRRNRKI